MKENCEAAQSEALGSGSELTEAQKTLFAELGIPESVALLPPDTCTCGVEGCTQHDTWCDRLIDGIFDNWEGPVPNFELAIERLITGIEFPSRVQR